MKHLKYFENIIKDEPITKLKKYCIWSISKSYYEILEIVGYRKLPDDTILYGSVELYRYNSASNEMKKLENEIEIPFSSSSIEYCVLYTSDNLEDCIEKLLFMVDTKKYNL